MAAASGSGPLVAGRVAVITGAAGGIGYAVARACARRGLRVAIADVNEKVLEEARARLAGEVGEDNVLAVQCNVASEASVCALKDAVYERWGEVGFLHLNAGVGGGDASVASTTQKDWERNIGVNLYGVTNGLRAFLPSMEAQGTPCAIAATSSWAGLFNAATFSGTPYVVSKAGAVLVMEALHFELRRKQGCRVTAHVLCPGRVNTNMLAGGVTADGRPHYERFLQKISDPQERAAEEVAWKERTRKATAGSMSPDEMAAVLVGAVETNRFYVLGYDDQQPLAWLKALAMLRAEDIVHERPPLSHRLPEGVEQRRILSEAMKTGSGPTRSRL